MGYVMRSRKKTVCRLKETDRKGKHVDEKWTEVV